MRERYENRKRVTRKDDDFFSDSARFLYSRAGYYRSGRDNRKSNCVSNSNYLGITEIGGHDYISRVYEGAEFYDENYQILESEE